MIIRYYKATYPAIIFFQGGFKLTDANCGKLRNGLLRSSEIEANFGRQPHVPTENLDGTGEETRSGQIIIFHQPGFL